MLTAIWKGASLRSWIAFGMAIAVLPLAASAFAGYFILHRGVLGAFQDVATRQREENEPTEHLRLLLVDATSPVDDFVDEGDAREPALYRETRTKIESTFSSLDTRFRDDAAPRAEIARARDDWTAADRIAAEILSARRAAGDKENAALMNKFHGIMDAADDKLEVVHNDLDRDLTADHDTAIRDAARAEWYAGAAALISVLAIAIGLFIVGRVISASVERLVSGAELFAAGDREHRIEIQLPPELHRVAAEFNRMIGRIHDSEGALADLARRDALTMLSNRRAFDEAMSEMRARQDRLGEEWALVVLDIDHFKRVNDTHGHASGDEVLRVTARAVVDDLRPFDRAFRIGGEEFAVILAAASRTTAHATAERLRQRIEAQPVPVGGVTIAVTASFGVAIGEPGADAAAILAAADAALYRAKAEGRNRVV